MGFIGLGISHKTAPLKLREKMCLGGERAREEYPRLKAQLPEVFLLNTCNRVEAYAWAEDAHGAMDILKKFMFGICPAEAEALEQSLYYLEGDAAPRHLLAVSASLDSMVVGEAQVLGQVKEAYRLAVEAQAVGPRFHGLFHRVFHAVKDVRTRSGIGRWTVSISGLAVDLSSRVFKDLSQGQVLLLGAGETGSLAARHFRSRGVGGMMVVNRSLDKAEELATLFQADVFPLARLSDALSRADIVICATSAPGMALDSRAVEAAQAARRFKPLLLIDLSVPRKIQPEAAGVEGVHLFNLDDLQQTASEHQGKRQAALKEAENMLEAHFQEILEWLRSGQVTPTISALSRWAEELRLAEMEKMRPKLKHLSEKDLQKVDTLTRLVVGSFLKNPLTKLREEARRSNHVASYTSVLHDLFGLRREDPVSEEPS